MGLALFCPVTGRAKGYPFEVPLPAGLPVSGVVLADHVKSLDWRPRRAEYIGDVPEEVVAEVIRRLELLLGETLPNRALQRTPAAAARGPEVQGPLGGRFR